MENQTLIDQFNKNSLEVVKVQTHEWKGNSYIDIRVWLPSESEGGPDIATKKGITLSTELIPELINCLHKAEVKLNGG